MISQEIVEFSKDNVYLQMKLEIGGFFHYDKPDEKVPIHRSTCAISCRDSFIYVWHDLYVGDGTMYFNGKTNRRTVGYVKSKIDIQKINSFFEWLETKLGIPNDQHTVFFPTNHKNAVAIVVSTFWIENFTRKSLFSLFLRYAASYFENEKLNAETPEGYKKLFNRYPLMSRCMDGILRFLDGYTQVGTNPLTYDNHIRKSVGFVAHFESIDAISLKEMLVKP